MNSNLITSKEVAKMLGISVASVNYYTNLRLLTIQEKKGNTRLYNKEEVNNTYKKIYRLRKEGYSLRLIQERLDKGYRI